jgi:hypothetical protein
VIKTLYTIVVVACLFLGQTQAQEPAGQRDRGKSLSLKEAIEQASNNRLPLSERVAVYEELTSRDAKERAEAVHALLAVADETIAAMAARSLVQDRNPDAAQAISSRIVKWSEPNQLAVLQELQNLGIDDASMQIPREVLREKAAQKNSDEKLARLSALDVAAMLLANSSIASDRSLLTTAVRAHPNSRGLWLALATQDTIEPSESALAESVYKNAELPPLIRAAAATALATKNQDAATFVVNEISTFLTRFANQSLEVMVAQAYSSKEAKESIIYYRQQVRLLGMLRFLRIPASELLTLKNLSAQNQEIRMILGLVTAIRWPERLLRENEGAFSNSEYESLLVAISLLHPPQTTLVETRIGSSRLSEVRNKLEKHGLVGVFGAPGIVALGG